MTTKIGIMHKAFSARLAIAAFLLPWGIGLAQVGAQVTASPSPAVPSHSQAGIFESGELTMVPEGVTEMALAPGFLLGLSVLDDSDFTGSFRVDQQGDVALPILGTMHVSGKTVAEARDQIRKTLLEDRILKDPQVNLTVLEYTGPQVTILGEVVSPGKYPLLTPHNLTDVLALAGGPTIAASHEVEIMHKGQSISVHYSRATDPKLVKNVTVDPGDTVQVQRAGIVYVLGAVNRAGGFVMQDEGALNVLEAIALAYGTSPLASTHTIYLLRRSANGPAVYTPLPYGQMVHGRAADVSLHANDVLYVPTNRIKSIYSSTATVLNSVATATIYATLE